MEWIHGNKIMKNTFDVMSVFIVKKMANSHYSSLDILSLFYIHGECGRVLSRTCRKFNELHPDAAPMTPKKFKRIEANFLNFNNVRAPRMENKYVTGNEENEVNVLAYFYAFPHASIYCAENDLDLSYMSIDRILHKHNMHNYKLITLQALEPDDHRKRLEFCEMILIRTQENPNFLKNIIWTDECKFSKEGIFNRRNSHFWASENPHFVRERNFQHKFSFNVFCLLMHNKIAFCLYDDNLTGAKYLDILRSIVSDFLDDLPLEILRNCFYQLDGAPAHCTHGVSAELFSMFEDRWIAREGPWKWPPRSPDLTPLDFYLWGRIKEIVYKTPVTTREDLENRVRTALGSIEGEEIKKVTNEHVITTIHECLRANGGHFKQFSY